MRAVSRPVISRRTWVRGVFVLDPIFAERDMEAIRVERAISILAQISSADDPLSHAAILWALVVLASAIVVRFGGLFLLGVVGASGIAALLFRFGDASAMAAFASPFVLAFLADRAIAVVRRRYALRTSSIRRLRPRP